MSDFDQYFMVYLVVCGRVCARAERFAIPRSEMRSMMPALRTGGP